MDNTSHTPKNSLHERHDKDKKILHFLKAVPHLEFSEKGIYNICKRFQVTPDYLFSLIEQVKKKGRKPAKNEPFNVPGL